MRSLRACLAAAGLALDAAGVAEAQTTAPTPTQPPFKPIAGIRLRYDQLNPGGQGTLLNTVKLRVLLGGEAHLGSDLRGLVDVEAIEAHYDNKGAHLSDLRLSNEAFDLNRAQLSWRGVPDTEVTVGRQTIVLNDGRFIGNGETRHNDQTFDALNVVNWSFAPLTLTYVYLDAALRPPRQVTMSARLDSDSHLLQADIETPLRHVSAYG